MLGGVHLEELHPDAADEIDDLRGSIDWSPGGWFLSPMIRAGGCVLGRRDASGRLIAMGGAALFGPMGFICNMVVRPEWKRQGLGRVVFEGLLSWLRARGIERVHLEATEEGKPLYEQYGFAARWESITAVATGEVEAGDESGIAQVSASDWPAIAALDRAAYGGDRSAFLRLVAEGPRCEEALRLVEGGRLTAFGFRLPGRIGPLVAADASSAEKLARALADRSGAGTLAPVGHPQHAAMWQRLGFEIDPYDVRMAMGLPVDDAPEMVFAMLNGGVG